MPELAPEILARASENGNNRMELGGHSPLDVIGGRISGEAGIAARWSDEKYREKVLESARAELVAYLEKQCGATIVAYAASGTPYTADPYGGAAMPGGSDQAVSDRASAVAVYRERLSYAYPASGQTGLQPVAAIGFVLVGGAAVVVIVLSRRSARSRWGCGTRTPPRAVIGPRRVARSGGSH